MLRSFQYLGEDHTFIRLKEGAEKVRVGHGEIVDSEMDPKIFLTNRFQEVGGGETKETGSTNAGNSGGADVLFKEIGDLTVAKLKEVAESHKIDLGDATKKADIAAVLSKKLDPAVVVEILAAANAANV